MKTKEEIIDYINRQPWGVAFYRNVVKFGNTPCSFDKYLIYSSFDWLNTEDGPLFWNDVNTKYMTWFDGEEHAVTSWEEYCERAPIIGEQYYYSEDGYLTTANNSYCTSRYPVSDVNVMPKELCEAFHAYMKLVQLKAYWDKDYDYTKFSGRYKLIFTEENDIVFELISVGKFPVIGFYFPTRKYANKFYETFKDLFKIAKPIL